MKIITGKYRNRNIFMPKDIRPTQNICRKAIFDILGHDWEGITFLELFAGSGAVGIEAISCGAQRVVMVEKSMYCIEVIDENIKKLGIEYGEVNFEVVQADAFSFIKQSSRDKDIYDIVFLDPPYGQGLAKKALKTLCGYDILHPNSFIVVQCDKKEDLSGDFEESLSLIKQKKYGASKLTIYQQKIDK